MEVGYKFDPVKHVHTLDGKSLYGVTSVLKAWGDKSQLVNWSANCAVDAILAGEEPEKARTAHMRKRDKAGDTGTAVHGELEKMMNDWIDEKEGEYEPVVSQVKSWMMANGITPLKSEMPVYSRDLWYGGIADGVIEKEGKKYILDFKTSGYVYTTAFVQCAAYSVAIKEMKPGAEVAGVVVVHIPRGASFNPEKNVYWFHDLEAIERMWKNILDSYKTDHTLQKLIQW